MKRVRADMKIDVRHLIAPISLLTVENRLSGMAGGQIAEVLCTDDETKADLVNILHNSNDQCIGFKVERPPEHFLI